MRAVVSGGAGQALAGEPMTVTGYRSRTRSLCQPHPPVREGLQRTIGWFASHPRDAVAAAPRPS